MQRDANEALTQRLASGGGGDAAAKATTASAVPQQIATAVQHGTIPQAQYALATQLQALAGHSPATIGVVHSVRGPVTAAFTLTAQAAPSTVAAPQNLSPTAQRLLSPVHGLVSTGTPATYQARTINVLQRQLSGQGIVGLSAVPAQRLSHNLSTSLSQSGIAVVSTTSSSDTRQTQHSVSLTPVSTVSASGGTIHHHGHSPTRGAPPPSNQPHSISMNVNQTAHVVQRRGSQGAASTTSPATPVTGRIMLDTRQLLPHPVSPITSTVTRNVQNTGQPPKKKAKLEEKPPATPEIAAQRKLVLEAKYKEMLEIKENYVEHLTELFFLKYGRNMMDYLAWKKRPTTQLVTFLKSGALDSDEEEEHLQEMRINDEVKVLTTAGSNVPLATPVAISTTLPPSVSALSQQGIKVFPDPSSQNTNMNPGSLDNFNIQDFLRQLTAYAKGSDSKFGQGRQPSALLPRTLSAAQNAAATPGSVASALGPSAVTVVSTSVPHSSGASTTTLSTTTVTASQLQMQLAKGVPEKQLAIQTTQAIKSPIASAGHTSSAQVRLPKSPTSPRLHTRRQSISAVYDSTIGSQAAIVERAKQEAQVVQRVSELRKDGMWSARRLPKVQEPPRNKAHWDYLLEEMTWLAADFIQERKWKKAAARKIARMVQKYHQDLEQKEIKAEKEEAQKLKKIAGQMAKIVKEFWSNIEKVVQYKQQSRMEEKRRKALDMHLNFIVDQTEKYSTWLTEGLHTTSSAAGSSVATSPEHSIEDAEFQPQGTASDDEETIEKEEIEAGIDQETQLKELEALQKESELPIEELIKSLPQEVLEKPAPVPSDGESLVKAKNKASDEEFTASEDEEDLEETIAEQEKHEKKKDYKQELEDLEAEGELSVEQLMQKYSGAYDSDFEMPAESSEEESEEDDSDDEIEAQSDEDETTEEEEEEESSDETSKQEDAGLSCLISQQEQEKQSASKQMEEESGPGKEITDIAAQAQSLQPKGYTLETTEVRTQVPFLLKHTLREYQHVGLDWLATMHDKKLNGILADEMGLGKTIQTIALLAHLACDKGVWGPHLIVVPTSVMLNWEMEFKKWCPAFKILTYYGNQKERKQKRTGWTKTNAFHVCITSYKLVVQDHSAFRRKKWKYFILDEAQNIKNFKSQRWQMLLNFQSMRRLLLTGTPLQNSLMELWSLMHFLMPHVFQSHKEFKEWFSNPLTGMVEGSQEYNDSLVRRLHKVLRPFLLRRLKADVEKQMPKKYEHVVMCRLSKRQRFLYDEFMSQTKTKETLAQGHFMSVINVLMQLRKVCNHPNLFDPRPIVSPFQMEGIMYVTASLVMRALEYDPFKHIDLHTLYPSLSEMELNLPAFIAHRVKNLQTPRKLIVEVDDQPEAPPRPKPGKLKPLTFRSISPATPQSGRSSPLVQSSHSRSASPVQLVKTVVRSATPTQILQPTPVQKSQGAFPIKLGVVSQPPTTVTATATPSTVQSLITSLAKTTAATSTVASTTTTTTPVQATIQAKVVPQQIQGVFHSSSSSMMPSQPITVQIQQTEQGTRLMIPTGQLSQLPSGLIQIVQSSSGQQLIATTSPAAPVHPVIPVQNVSTASTTASVSANGPTSAATTLATSITSMLSTSTPVTPAVTQVKSVPAVQLPSGSIFSPQKPIMRVTPMAVSSSDGVTMSVRTITPVTTTASATAATRVVPSTGVRPTATVCSSSKSNDSNGVISSLATSEKKESLRRKLKEESSELFLQNLKAKRCERRRQKLEYIACVNRNHCERKPVYGQDFCEAVNVTSDVKRTRVIDNLWHGLGRVHCMCAHLCTNPYHPDYYWQQSETFKKLIHTPVQYLEEMREALSRFVFVTPPVVSPTIKMRVFHPPPSVLHEEQRMSFLLHKEVSPKTAPLHSISTKMMVQFPELRLIEYDCGKLQTMDILLHRLKSGSHRVLIFTQMTRMLDVLEAFLSYHGHRYLRLDGTTKVEQRQALMDRFNMDRRIFCFILSTRSGGIGVNLTGADTVIFYDSDWNPTMDAQAQDRCHRIGQTRDVHIYRLISEKTIEENILKKANQKRLLGDLAIEGGNFTTAFFKENTIKELFEEPSGLDALAKEKQAQAELRESKIMVKEAPPAKKPEEANVLAQFEQALCKAEDENDAIAVKLVKAEQKAELAEFDESIPWDEKEAETKKEEEVSKVELELAQLDKELTPIERYAVCVMEAEMEPDTMEELMLAEEDIENSKKEWELARLKALKEEEERRLEIEEDEMLYTYSRDDAYNQMYVSDFGTETMPIWAPPTPPKDDNDVYLDQTMAFLYEPNPMTETQLPPVYVRKEHKKPRIETVTTRKQKQRKEEQPRVPRSLFDRPTAALMKLRREAKLQKLKQGLIKPSYRPTTTSAAPAIPSKPTIEVAQDHPEWLIHEDWALLQAVQTLLSLPLNLMVVAPAHIPNWDLVADVVNSCSRVYRSPKQCRNRYENVIIPREEGRILYDISPRKQKKTKGIYKTKNNRPMRTSQLYIQDGNNSVTMLYSLRFDSIKSIAGKRPPTMRQTLVNPTMKNPKHAAVLQDSGIVYDTPLTPIQVAANRAERIAREKKQNQQAAAAAAAEQQLAAQRTQQQAQQQTVVTAGAQHVQGTSTTTTPVVTANIQASHLQPLVSVASTSVISGAVQKMAVGQGMTAVSIPRTGNIVVNTPGIPNTFAAINKRMSQQANTAVAVTGSLAQVRARAPVAVHEITAVTTQAVQVSAVTQPATATLRTTTASANLNHAQIASQRIAALTGSTVQGKATVQQQLAAQSALKSITPQHINILRQQQTSIVRPPAQQPQQAIRAQKLSITQKQNLLNKSGKLTEEQLLAFRQRQMKQVTTTSAAAAGGQGQLQLQVSQPQVRQIIQAQVQQVGNQPATSQPVATLVKSVSAPTGTSVSGTIPVSINVSVTQHKTGVTQRATVSQLQQQQQQQKMFLTQQRKASLGQKVTTLSQAQVAKTQQIPLIFPQQKGGLPISGQLLTQIVKHQQQGGQGATIQQIITHASQPTIIATVTQGQPTQPVVAKVSLATSTPTAHIQTLSGATPITVTQVASATGQSHAPITLNVATPVSQGGTPTVVKATAVSADQPSIQIQQTGTGSQQPKITTISQSLVTQQLQQLQANQQVHQIQATALPSSSSQAASIQVHSPAVTPQASPAPSPATVTVSQQQIIPQTATIASVVTQAQQQQQGASSKSSPYAMRTRTTRS